MKTRKVPMRRCIGCMESKPKRELIRIVADKSDNDKVILDATGKSQGRGAYLCPSKECFNTARKRKAITRSLEVQASEEQLDMLAQEFEKYEQ